MRKEDDDKPLHVRMRVLAVELRYVHEQMDRDVRQVEVCRAMRKLVKLLYKQLAPRPLKRYAKQELPKWFVRRMDRIEALYVALKPSNTGLYAEELTLLAYAEWYMVHQAYGELKRREAEAECYFN